MGDPQQISMETAAVDLFTQHCSITDRT